jgi:hypothetical protein
VDVGETHSDPCWSSIPRELMDTFSVHLCDAPPLQFQSCAMAIRLGYGCAAKAWATAPRLKTMVLTGSMVSGARKSRSPAPRMTGWVTRRYSSIKPVSISDRANRAPPWASR